MATVQAHPLSVPVPSHDLTPTELLLQSFNNLDLLHHTVTDIFSTLNNRIAQQRDRLKAAQTRIQQCNDKVKQISANPNQVYTVYSSATFPAMETTAVPNEPRLFKRVHTQKSAHVPPAYQLTENQYSTPSAPADVTDLFITLSKATNSRSEQNFKNADKEGLGRFPNNITSASAAILFNSEENPYKNYDSFNNLDSVADARKKVKKQQQLAAAPTTLSTGTNLAAFSGLQFEYRPDLGAVPTFALPQQLDLKNVANINWQESNFALTSIAPSLALAADLPSFGMSQQITDQNKKAQGKKSKKNAGGATTPAPQMQNIAPPSAATIQPPSAAAPAPPMAEQQTSAQQPQSPPPQQQQLAAPQMPTATAAPQLATTTPTQPVPSKPALPALPAGRGSLLDSIKNGLQLKKVTEEDVQAQSTKPVPGPAASAGNNLQAALFAGIKRRAAIMNGKDPDAERPPPSKPAEPAGQPGLTKTFDARIQQRLQKQQSDSEHSESDDDW